jgi:hypothetical protein
LDELPWIEERVGMRTALIADKLAGCITGRTGALVAVFAFGELRAGDARTEAVSVAAAREVGRRGRSSKRTVQRARG